MKKFMTRLTSTLLLAAFSSLVIAADEEPATYVIDQKDKQFSKSYVKLRVGGSIDFRNNDPWMHNVFSLSEVQSFDLGSYPKPQAKRVVFDKVGKVDVECAIHPQMHMVVEVVK